jgi:hypothetical protein
MTTKSKDSFEVTNPPDDELEASQLQHEAWRAKNGEIVG